MDFSSSSDWLTQLGVEEDLMEALMFENHMKMSCDFDDFLFQPFDHLSFGTDQSSFPSDFNSTVNPTEINNNNDNNNNTNNFARISSTVEDSRVGPERLSRLMKSSGCSTSEVGERIISFGSSKLEDPTYYGAPHVHVPYDEHCLISGYESFQYDPDLYSANANVVQRSAQEHVLSERRRRERLAQKFLELTAVLPGLPSKMSKASILEQAMKHMKQLREQIKSLEKQTRGEDVSSSLCPQVFVDQDHVNEYSCSEDNYFKTSPCDQLQHPFLEILARRRDRNVLIRATVRNGSHDCDPMSEILYQIGKLKLTTVRTNAMPFGTSKLIITVTVQMDDDFHMALKDLVRHLQQPLSLQMNDAYVRQQRLK